MRPGRGIPSGGRPRLCLAGGMSASPGTAREQDRAPLRRSLRRALLAVLCAALLSIALLLVAVPPSGPGGPGLLIFPVSVLLHVLIGLLAWDRRPESLMGPLLLLSAVAMLLAGLGNSMNAPLAAVGTLAATLPLATLIHMLLAFPTGRLRSGWARAAVTAGYLASTVLGLPAALWGPDPLFGAAPRPELAALGGIAQSTVGTAAFAATAAVLTVRIRRATPAERRVLAPLSAFGVVSILLLLTASQLLPTVFGWSAEAAGYLQLSVLTIAPIAVVAAALRGGIARAAELEELGVWLAHVTGERADVSAVLTRALGDPSLELWFWDPHAARYLDAAGRPIDADRFDPRRALEEVGLEGRRIGALVYDPALVPDVESVRTASRAVAIALDRERLTALLRASRADLQRSRERLVEVADAERRRIAQDLHDGLQAELVLLGIEAQQLAHAAAGDRRVAERAVGLRRSIDRSAAGLRELVHDVMPASLVQRGLSAAAEDLVDRMPIPVRLSLRLDGRELPPAVESTVYFVIAEALANVVKHAEAGSGSVRIEIAGSSLHLEVGDDGCGGARPGSGSGLTGIAERIDVLGGAWDLCSPAGGGTRIRAEVPCG